MPKILILVHRDCPIEGGGYWLQAMAKLWQQEGRYDVIVQRGPGRHVPADIVISHLDVSVAPDEYLAVLRSYPVAVNGRVTDISKLGFDYGKFDYVMTDNGAALFDANWTPTLGNLPESRATPQVALLAEGIGSFL